MYNVKLLKTENSCWADRNRQLQTPFEYVDLIETRENQRHSFEFHELENAPNRPPQSPLYGGTQHVKYEICCSGNWELNFGVITLVNQFNNKVEAVFISSGHERKESRLCILFPWCNTASYRFKHWSETWTFVDAMAHCWLIWLFFPLKCFWARCEPFQMKTDPTVWNLGEFDLISS